MTGSVQIATLRKYLHATNPTASTLTRQSGAMNTTIWSVLKWQDQAFQKWFPSRPLIKTLCPRQSAAFTVPFAHGVPSGLLVLVHATFQPPRMYCPLSSQTVQSWDPDQGLPDPSVLSQRPTCTGTSPSHRSQPSGFFLGALGLPWTLPCAVLFKYTLTSFLKFV